MSVFFGGAYQLAAGYVHARAHNENFINKFDRQFLNFSFEKCLCRFEKSEKRDGVYMHIVYGKNDFGCRRKLI